MGFSLPWTNFFITIYICLFSHQYSKIPWEKQLKGENVYFDSPFTVQCSMTGKSRGLSQLITGQPQGESREQWIKTEKFSTYFLLFMQSWISCWRIILHTWTRVFSLRLTRSSFIGILRSIPHRWLYIFINLTMKSKNHRHHYYFCWTTLFFQKIWTYKIHSESHFPTSWPHYYIFCIYHVL